MSFPRRRESIDSVSRHGMTGYMPINTSPKKIEELLSRGVVQVTVKESLEKKLRSGKKLRIKHGVDPTTNDLHIGYAVVYEKLRQLQEMGHTIIFLIGDFTARFGDPTDKVQQRIIRDKKEVATAAKSYLKQIGAILDMKKTEVRHNSEWYDKMSAEDLLRLMSRFTVARMLERDMFDKRQKKGEEIGLHEPVYPVLQAWDSVMLKADATVIGTDQLFNELQARRVQEQEKQTPQDVIAMDMLVGTDGTRKMSQSLGNYIGIAEAAVEQYGKLMSIPDTALVSYLTLATRMPMKEVEFLKEQLAKNAVNPRDVKMRLAREVVTIYHGDKTAEKAQESFIKQFQKHEMPKNIKEVQIKSATLLEILVETKLVSSKAEARRMLDQNAVKIDGEKVTDGTIVVKKLKGKALQVGKRRFVKIK